MRYKTKKLITHAVSAILMLALIPLTAFTAPTDTESPPGDVSLYDVTQPKAVLREHYMGSAGKLGQPQEHLPHPTTMPENGFETDEVIWIGIAIDDFEHFERARDEGMYNIEMAIDYDPAYIAPCDKQGNTIKEYEAQGKTLDEFNDDWLNGIKEASMAAGADVKDPNKWDSDIYDFYEGCTARRQVNNYARNSNPPTNDSALDKMSMLYLDIGRKDGVSGESRFTGVTNAEAAANEFYIVMLPFRIINNAEPTETYFALTLGPQTFAMGFGDGSDMATRGTDSYAAWEADTSDALRAAINLQTYLTFAGDLFEVGDVQDTIRFELTYDTVETVKIVDTEDADGDGDTTDLIEATPDPDTGLVPTETVTHNVDIFHELDLTEDAVHGTPKDEYKIVPTEDKDSDGINETWAGSEFDKLDSNRANPLADGQITNAAGGDPTKISSFIAEVPSDAKAVDLEIIKKLRTNDGLSVSFSDNASNYQDPSESGGTGGGVGGGAPVTNLFKNVPLSDYTHNAETNDYSYTNADKGQPPESAEEPSPTPGATSAPTPGAEEPEPEPKSMTLSDVNMKSNLGFNNMIQVAFDGKLYNIYIRKLVEPEIKLNYGNSPVGLIMRDDIKFPTKDDKQMAIDSFCENNSFIDDTVTPDGGDQSVIYSPDAWLGQTDKSINMDRNEDAIFAFFYEPAYDPGFSITNSYGETQEISSENPVTRTTEYYDMQEIGTAEDLIDMFTNAVQGSVDEMLTDVNDDSYHFIMPVMDIYTRPGIYKITYSWEDIKKGTVTGERPIIYVPHAGDVTFDSIANKGDATSIQSKRNLFPNGTQEGIEKNGALFYYRGADVTFDAVANNADINAINAKKVTEYYKKDF